MFEAFSQWLRECFCRHVWRLEEQTYEAVYWNNAVETGIMVSATCTTCGWNRTYKKFSA